MRLVAVPRLRGSEPRSNAGANEAECALDLENARVLTGSESKLLVERSRKVPLRDPDGTSKRFQREGLDIVGMDIFETALDGSCTRSRSGLRGSIRVPRQTLHELSYEFLSITQWCVVRFEDRDQAAKLITHVDAITGSHEARSGLFALRGWQKVGGDRYADDRSFSLRRLAALEPLYDHHFLGTCNEHAGGVADLRSACATGLNSRDGAACRCR